MPRPRSLLGKTSIPSPKERTYSSTPLQFGLADQSARLPLDTATLRPETLVIDLVVNPPQTRLLRDAAQRGCPTLHGLSMLVKQCAANFKIWTGIAPDETVMRESLEEYLEF